MARVRRKIGVKLLAHLEMARPYTMFYSGMLGAAGAQVGSGGATSIHRTLACSLVDICGWEAGLYAGDYYDRDIDAKSKPYRAIPSGRVSPREAFLTMCGLIGMGYGSALALSPANLGLAVFTTALGISYSKTFKDKAVLGNFDRGVLGICAVLFGGLTGKRLRKSDLALLCTATFFHDSASNLVGAIRDLEGDRAANCRTVPVVYGLTRSVNLAVALAASSTLLALALEARTPRNAVSISLFCTALAISLGVYGDLLLSQGRVTRPQALRAHKYLVAERLMLMGSLIASYRPRVALAMVVLSLAGSLGSQKLLRDRYDVPEIGHLVAEDE